ncbi:hypothetical protein SBC1_42180 (plasmid) [Caballeronia sp. SBC1]|uniref:hypothetical protein n=1 Tax=unclassified Caballeronia TaxID=2646786 RepID=UPI0013E149D2|nr:MULTISPECIES: hypothetical protein [unclassified Caballeronia]QIE26506.1 hypothetical protein SBC2_45760 [Caballeronia sp. SBC2]QIN64178.1 hypothetical protein SBC1_42180 [Caballeronia sp. SBC1]
MFQLFNHDSSTRNSDQATLRMDDNLPAEKVALSGERPATYEEMLPWLLLGAVVGF